MAKAKAKKPNLKNNPERTGNYLRGKFKKIWEYLTLEELYAYLNKLDSTAQFSIKSNHIVARCKLGGHIDNNPSLEIFPQDGKHYYICRSHPGGQLHGDNIVRLVSAYGKMSMAEALADIIKKFNIKGIFTAKDNGHIEIYEEHQAMKHRFLALVKQWTSEAVCEYVNNKEAMLREDNKYRLAYNACEYLEKRGILDVVNDVPVGILPHLRALQDVAKALKLTVREFDDISKYISPIMRDRLRGSIMFTYMVGPRQIGKFRFRVPDITLAKPDIEALKDKYEENIGIFGIDIYSSMYSDADNGVTCIGNTECVHLVEGEFDLLQMYMQQKMAGKFDVVMAAHAGKANLNLDCLKRFGLKKVLYIPDNDDGGRSNTITLLQNNPSLFVKVFHWPHSLVSAKPEESLDLDSALRGSAFELVNSELLEMEKNYVTSDAWIKQECIAEIEESGDLEDERSMQGTILSWVDSLRGSNDESMSAQITKTFSYAIFDYFMIPRDRSTLMVDSISCTGDPEALVRADMKEHMLKRYAFMFNEGEMSVRQIHLWDRKKENQECVRSASDSDIKAFFGNSLGSWLTWYSTEIGPEPDIIRYGRVIEEGEPHPPSRLMSEREKHLNGLARIILSDISASLPMMTKKRRRQAGNHWEHVKDVGGCWLVQNGKKVFMGSYTKERTLKWSRLDVPLLDDMYFDVKGGESYSKYINDIEDLNNMPEIDLRNVHSEIKAILNAGWRFHNQEVWSTYLACLAMVTPVMKALPINVQLYASAERNSGKSTLVSRFFGGMGKPFYNVIEHTLSMDSVTSAGIRQFMDGNPRLMTLDEFDEVDKNKNSGDANAGVMKLLRTGYTGGTHRQGNSTGTGTARELSFSAMFAGIDPSMPDANRSRLIAIPLKGIDSIVSPEISLEQKFGLEYFAKLTRKVSLGMFAHSHKFQGNYTRIKNHFSKNGDKIPPNITQRWKDSAYVAMTVYMEMFPDTWEDFFLEFCGANMDQFATVKEATEYSNLWDTLLLSPTIEIMGLDITGRKTTVMDVLSRPEDRYKLNSSGSGIFYCENSKIEEHYLGVVWSTARKGVLNGDHLSRVNNASLRDKAGRHPMAIKESDVEGILNSITGELPNIKHTQVSLWKITDMLKEFKMHVAN